MRSKHNLQEFYQIKNASKYTKNEIKKLSAGVLPNQTEPGWERPALCWPWRSGHQVKKQRHVHRLVDAHVHHVHHGLHGHHGHHSYHGHHGNHGLQGHHGHYSYHGHHGPLINFTSSPNLAPFIVSLMLMFGQQLSGMNAVMFYCVDIFKVFGG